MPLQSLPTVAQMTDLTNAIHALIGAIVLGLAGVIGAYLYQVKVSLPRIFKQRDEERTAQIEAAKLELKNKAEAEAVDIERDRMLPKLIESTIQMSQTFTSTMIQNTQQTSAYIAQLGAHDRQLTANTAQLGEVVETIEQAITNIQVLTTAINANTDNSKAAAAFGEKAALAAEETLALIRKKIIQVVEDTKSDTGELPAVNDLPKASGA